MIKSVEALRLVSLASFFLFSAAGGCSLLPEPERPDYSATLGVGVVERFRPVFRDAAGFRLGPIQTLDAAGLYEAPSEFEEGAWIKEAAVLGVGDFAAASGVPSAGCSIGTIYFVRLRSGGVVYAFESGQRVLDLGQKVHVQHGIMPRLMR
jgi:hypothetical protein